MITVQYRVLPRLTSVIRLTTLTPTSTCTALTDFQQLALSNLPYSFDRRCISSTSARYGFLGKVRTAFHDARSTHYHKREERQFAATCELLLRPRDFDGEMYTEYLQRMRRFDGMAGMSMYMPWNRGNGILENFVKQEKVLGQMSTEEKVNFVKLDGKRLRKIVRKSEMDIKDVEFVKTKVEELLSIQIWLKNRVKEGKRLPYTEAEMRSMMQYPGQKLKWHDDKPGTFVKKHGGRSPQLM